MRYQPRRPRLRPGPRQAHATAPPRQDTPPAAVLRPRSDRPYRPPDDHAPARRVPTPRRSSILLITPRSRSPAHNRARSTQANPHPPRHHPHRRPGKRPPRRPTQPARPINAAGVTRKHPSARHDHHRQPTFTVYPERHTPRSRLLTELGLRAARRRDGRPLGRWGRSRRRRCAARSPC